jgi:hypothetical protein
MKRVCNAGIVLKPRNAKHTFEKRNSNFLTPARITIKFLQCSNRVQDSIKEATVLG